MFVSEKDLIIITAYGLGFKDEPRKYMTIGKNEDEKQLFIEKCNKSYIKGQQIRKDFFSQLEQILGILDNENKMIASNVFSYLWDDGVYNGFQKGGLATLFWAFFKFSNEEKVSFFNIKNKLENKKFQQAIELSLSYFLQKKDRSAYFKLAELKLKLQLLREEMRGKAISSDLYQEQFDLLLKKNRDIIFKN